MAEKMKNNLEEAWNEEYKNFMLSFYHESSPPVLTWEIYRVAKIKSQKEIEKLLELTETLNQVRDNLQGENRRLEHEIQETRRQLEIAEKVINVLCRYNSEHENFRREKQLQEQNKIMREALESISKNGCCEPCQEAKLVARSALEKQYMIK